MALLFGDTKLVVEYDKQYVGTHHEQWNCKHCGREFFPYWDGAAPDGSNMPEGTERARQDLMRGCPSDDCPSHWEEQGLMNPEHHYSHEEKQALSKPSEEKLAAWREAEDLQLAARDAPIMVVTMPEMTWRDLADKIAFMTQQQREQPVTVQHDGLGRLYHVHMTERDSHSPVDEFGSELYPDEMLACTVEVLMTPD